MWCRSTKQRRAAVRRREEQWRSTPEYQEEADQDLRRRLRSAQEHVVAIGWVLDDLGPIWP